jgi:hypothetical protein
MDPMIMRFDRTNPSDSRRRAVAAPNYLSRSVQTRLLVLLSMLVLVLFLMIEARKPKNWRWLWANRPESESPRDDVQTGEPPLESSAGQGYLPGVSPSDFAKLKDNAVYRPSEAEVWQRWLEVLGREDQATLEAASLGHVGFVQLFHQTAEFRGRVVTVSGTVRRAFYLVSPPGSGSIQGYWQCWLFAGRVNSSPLVVHTLKMPAHFPQGIDINQEVEFTGLVYKRWAYPAADGVRLAPLLLAKQGDWTPNAPQTQIATPGFPVLAGLIMASAVLGMSAVWFVWARSRSRSRKTGNYPVTLDQSTSRKTKSKIRMSKSETKSNHRSPNDQNPHSR